MILGNGFCDVEMKGTEPPPCPVEILGIISFELSYSTTRASSKSVLNFNAKRHCCCNILTAFGACKAADNANRFECEVIFNKSDYFF
jgi:hypothetical protein